MRLKFLTLLVVFVLGVGASVLRFGISFLQGNYFSQLSTNYRNSVEFMTCYGLLNFYIYTMAYVYSPINTAVLGRDLEFSSFL